MTVVTSPSFEFSSTGLPGPPMRIPPVAPVWPSQSGGPVADIGLGTADANGLGKPGDIGLRNFDAGVLSDLACVGGAGVRSVIGPWGGGGLTTGKYDSAYHSYHIRDFPVNLQMDTWSSQLLGR